MRVSNDFWQMPSSFQEQGLHISWKISTEMRCFMRSLASFHVRISSPLRLRAVRCAWSNAWIFAGVRHEDPCTLGQGSQIASRVRVTLRDVSAPSGASRWSLRSWKFWINLSEYPFPWNPRVQRKWCGLKRMKDLLLGSLFKGFFKIFFREIPI